MGKTHAALGFCLLLLSASLPPRGHCESEPTGVKPSFTPASPEDAPAAGMFLVAQRELRDLYFGHTVILLLQHDAEGSLGLIVNRRFDLNLAEAVPELDHAEAENHALSFGGPVGTHQVFMLLRDADALPGAYPVTEGIYFSGDRRVLDEMLTRKATDAELRLFIGYAGWGEGQLARELQLGSWHLVHGDSKAVFDGRMDGLWHRLIKTLEPLGIEVRREHGSDLLVRAGGL